MAVYCGYLIVAQSELQTELPLTTMEAEIISLSTVLTTAILLMEIAKELKAHGYHIITTMPVVHCKAFENNSNAFKLSTPYKYWPRTQ